MKKFLKQLLYFLLVGVVVGEVVLRVFNLTIDTPKLYQGKNKIIRYAPNQEGNYQNAGHRWKINEYGYSGEAPESFDNLITIIGDSYIVNFMNPDSCHQNVYLKKLLPKYNYFQAGRGGAALLEMLETAKALDTLSPKLQVLYVSDLDFVDCIANRGKKSDVELNLETNKITYKPYKPSKVKDIIYNFKFAYYCYRNIYLTEEESSNVNPENNDEKLPIEDVAELIDYVKENYQLTNTIFVFKPDNNNEIIELCRQAGIKTFLLDDDNDESWIFEHDRHWTCYGHHQVAKQVKVFIQESLAD